MSLHFVTSSIYSGQVIVVLFLKNLIQILLTNTCLKIIIINHYHYPTNIVCIDMSRGLQCLCLPVFEGCSADTIMVVAVWGPVTNDCVEAVGTSVPWGVVITNPAKRKRETVMWLSIKTNILHEFSWHSTERYEQNAQCPIFRATIILCQSHRYSWQNTNFLFLAFFN